MLGTISPFFPIFALQKLSTFHVNVYHDWRKAQNIVAKRYKKEHTPRDVYFMDVLVQVGGTLWAVQYSCSTGGRRTCAGGQQGFRALGQHALAQSPTNARAQPLWPTQMDAKLMGEEYNKTDPPKQVDMMQASIVEFKGEGSWAGHTCWHKRASTNAN